MIRAVLLTLALLLALAAPASAKLTFGIGEQNPALFTDERWRALKAPHVRYVVPWDALRRKGFEVAELDSYMYWARQTGARVMVTFGASRRRGRQVKAPAVLDAPNMTRWILRFKRAARYPVRIWSIHNHIDANRHRTTGTREILRITRGQLWFSETGGIVHPSGAGRTN